MFSRCGFNDKRRNWFRACVFSKNLMVLVNGCLIQEISIQMGLNQWNSLAPFLFLLVAEGLSDLISRAVEIYLLSDVRVRFSNLMVSHLQYADDTIILVDATIDDIWTIKAILCGSIGMSPWVGDWPSLTMFLISLLYVFLSFLKMSVKVWQNIVKIHRMFLWRGVKRESKIAWVKWMDFCKPKKLGGLRVHDLRLVNLAPLGKWRWRLPLGDYGIWFNILRARFGDSSMTSILGGRVYCLISASPRWRGVSLLGFKADGTSDYFKDGLSLKVSFALYLFLEGPLGCKYSPSS